VLGESGKHKKSEKVLRQAIELKVCNAWTWLLLGIELILLKRHAEAEPALREAIRLGEGAVQVGAAWLLVGVLAELGRWNEAIDGLPRVLQNEPFVRDFAMAIAEFMVHASAAGYPAEMLAPLKSSPARLQLEPVFVALQILAGEDHNAPQEVVEVAKDIVQQIKDLEGAYAHERAGQAERS
jgi:tetratricopeptide (TPR) repeat protein